MGVLNSILDRIYTRSNCQKLIKYQARVFEFSDLGVELPPVRISLGGFSTGIQNIESAGESAKALDDFQYQLCRGLENKTLKEQLDKETWTKYIKIQFAANALILGFRATLLAYEASYKNDPEKQTSNLDNIVKAILKLVTSLSGDIDQNYNTQDGRDAISTAISKGNIKQEGRVVDEHEIDFLLTSKFEENQKAILQKITEVEQEVRTVGLELLNPIYFEQHKRVQENVKGWYDGYPLSLESIYYDNEFKRDNLLNEIISKLNVQKHLILVGEAGSSKTTLLNEVICYFFKQNYTIFYSYGDKEINDPEKIRDTIEDTIRNGKKVLIAVDNVHESKMLAIFQVIELLESFDMNEHVIFILTARLPEYNDLLDKRLTELTGQERLALRKFNTRPDVIYKLPYFTVEEIEKFFTFYEAKNNMVTLTAKSYADIFQQTNGYPILVKFFLVGKGLRDDVEDRYTRYLCNSESKPFKPIDENIQTMIICALFSISNQTITDKILEDMKIKKSASNIGGILHKKQDGTWSTIHPKWDMEFFRFLFYRSSTCPTKEIDIKIDDETNTNLKIACNTVFEMKNKQFSRSVISVLYNMAGQRIIPVTILNDNNVLMIPEYITNDPDAMCSIYVHDKGKAYYYLKRYDDMSNECDKALEINQKYAGALRNKGLSKFRLCDYHDAITFLKSALALDERDIDAWNIKGLAHIRLGENEKALESLEEALKINPNYHLALDNKGLALYGLNRISEAIHFADKAIYYNPLYADAWYDRAIYRIKENNTEEGIRDLQQAIRLDIENIDYAKADKGFDAVRNDERFMKLIGINN